MCRSRWVFTQRLIHREGKWKLAFLPAHNEFHTIYKRNASTCETLRVVFIPQARSSSFKVTFLIYQAWLSGCCAKSHAWEERCLNAMPLPAEDIDHWDKIGVWWAAALLDGITGASLWSFNTSRYFTEFICQKSPLVSISQARVQLFASLQRVSLFHCFHSTLGRQLY